MHHHHPSDLDKEDVNISLNYTLFTQQVLRIAVIMEYHRQEDQDREEEALL